MLFQVEPPSLVGQRLCGVWVWRVSWPVFNWTHFIQIPSMFGLQPKLSIKADNSSFWDSRLTRFKNFICHVCMLEVQWNEDKNDQVQGRLWEDSSFGLNIATKHWIHFTGGEQEQTRVPDWGPDTRLVRMWGTRPWTTSFLGQHICEAATLHLDVNNPAGVEDKLTVCVCGGPTSRQTGC